MPSAANLGQIVDGVWLSGIAAWPIWTSRMRRVLLNIGGVRVGRSGVLRDQQFASGHRVVIGDDTFINIGCLFDSAAQITIGHDVHVGPGAAFLTSAHDIGPTSRRAGENRPRAITVHDGVWIGARAVIMPGVTIGRGSVIAAGAIVTRDTEPDAIYAGVPARRVRSAQEAVGTA